MAEDKAPVSDEQAIEYSIFVHHHPKDVKEAGKESEKIEVTNNMDAALKKGEALSKSGQYQKVEIRQKYFEEKTKRNIDVTLKVFDHKPKKPIGLGLIIGFTVVCGILAFVLAYFLGNNMR